MTRVTYTLSLAFILGLQCLSLAEEKPAAEPEKVSVDAAKTPFEKDFTFKEGDACIVVLPNKKEVAIWVEKARFNFGEQKTKSGLQCSWGEKAFELVRPKDTYIRLSVVSTSTREMKSEYRLFIDEWQLSYINDLNSAPELKVKVVVKKREEMEKK